jgi:sulfur-carrier protein
MPVKVLIPTPLRPHASGNAAAEYEARTVDEALQHLTAQFAGLKQHLFTEDGKLRSFVNVYLNGEDIRYLAKGNTPTKDGDTINIIPSIAGGTRADARPFGAPRSNEVNRNFWLAGKSCDRYTIAMLNRVTLIAPQCCCA